MTSDDRHPVEILAEEFVRRHRAGEAPSVEEYVAANPEHTEEIRALLPAALAMEGLKESRESTGSGQGRRLELDADIERLGDFRIVEEIGRGGMGIVFDAEQESLGRHVAVKVLPRQAMKDARRVQRFESEARTAANLHHTNIVPVFGVGEQDGLHYYVMQLIDGVGLDEVLSALRVEDRPDEGGRFGAAAGARALRREGPYDRVVARIGIQVAEALAYAHDAGTLHRDIKPANLLLDSRGEVWITDFGIARALEAADLTRTGDVVGTLQYMAPEQSDGEFDARSDVYGLGVTLYEILTLRRAYDERTPATLLRKIRDGNVMLPSRIDPSIPRDLETVIMKAMAPEPRHRYESAHDLADDLRRYTEDLPIRARRITPIETVWRWCRRNRAVASLGAVAAASLLVAAVTGWTGYVARGESLVRESAGREQAMAEAKRAERNLELSLEAFDDIFDRVAGPDRFIEVSEESTDETVIVETTVSQKDADLLARVLQFYGAFAEANATNARLQVEAARAQRRVGEIHDRLGNVDEAERAYLSAIAMHSRIAPTPETADRLAADLARAHSRMADLLHRGRKRAEALIHAETARRVAEEAAIDPENLQSRHTLVTVLHDAADLRARRGPGRRRRGSSSGTNDEAREALELLDRAVAVAEETANHHPENPRVALDLAISRRKRAWFLWYSRDANRTEVEAEAIALLEDIQQRWPERDDVKLELATALRGPMSRFFSRDREFDEDAVSRLERARTLTAEINARSPGATAVESSHAETLGMLGIMRWTRDDPAAAEPLIREALDIWEGLDDRTSDRFVRIKMTGLRFVLVDVLRDLDRPDEAIAFLKDLITASEGKDDRWSRGLLHQAYRTLSQILESNGDAEAAKEAADKASSFRRHRGERRGPPADRP